MKCLLTYLKLFFVIILFSCSLIAFSNNNPGSSVKNTLPDNSPATGTLSGRLRLSDNTRPKPYKNDVMITDGKFNIPFSTGNIRPE